MFHSHQTLRAKLTMTFVGLALLVLIASGIAMNALSNANQTFQSFVNGINTRALLAQHIQAEVQARAIAARNLVLVTKDSDVATEKAAVLKADAAVTSELQKLNELVSGPNIPPEVKSMVEAIDKIELVYGPVARDIVKLALDNQREQAIAKMNDECRPLLASLIQATETYASKTAERSQELVAEAQAAYALNKNLLIGACVFAFLAAAIAGTLLTRGILGALGEEPAALGIIAQRVAQGDLTHPVEIRGAGNGSVLASLAVMQQNLTRIVGQVRGASDSIATGSAQIAMGNADLSQRTEQQASALEETAATMEEFGTTVEHNANNAKTANQLAINASVVAEKGGAVVGQVVATMKGINDSSKKIADIISVIDGIAFQTNILALNAAVEAARAGDQGRGFAVVATEVRSLAGRSAEAAKEIKSLIGASVEKVEQGTLLVDQAGQTMDEVVTSIRRVGDIVSEITSATSEQNLGISQIGQAISQLDQTTQQNAALVEQSAAAAQSLEHQAQGLVAAVSVFKLVAPGAALMTAA